MRDATQRASVRRTQATDGCLSPSFRKVITNGHGAASPRIEFVPVDQLSTADYNPRRIEAPKLEALQRSLREDPRFFLQRPCLVNRRKNGQLVIYAGNMRYEAAKANGQDAIPCLIDTISVNQEKLRNLKDNNAYGEYVDEALAGMIYGLREAGTDLSALGFSPREVSALYTEGLIAAGGTPPIVLANLMLAIPGETPEEESWVGRGTPQKSQPEKAGE